MFLFQQLTKDTQMHCRRVSELAVKLAVLCGEPVVNQTKISVAAIYHDIGKIKLPEEILNKKEPLTDEEYNLIKQHTNFGSVLMKGYCSDDICQMIQYHHENIDGSGYYRLTEIPLGSRIIGSFCLFNLKMEKLIVLVDYERLLDYLTERTYAGDGLQETNLTGLKFTLKGVDYEVLEHTKDKYRVLMLNRKAISK